jgi:hypothetical protein
VKGGEKSVRMQFMKERDLYTFSENMLIYEWIFSNKEFLENN